MAMVLVPSALLASPKVDCGKAAVRISCFCNSRSEGVRKTKSHEPRVFDNLFLSLFRNKMVQETGWDSEKPGYEGLIEVAHRLTLAQDNSQTRDAAVRILRSLFPPLLLELYRMLVAPIDSGKFAALMVARVTALSCQWLMGPCTVNSVDLPHGPSLMSGVFVEKCKYLEESKCVGVCINTCKLPTQTFFKDHMGVPLLMEPNFTDYSCQGATCVLVPGAFGDRGVKGMILAGRYARENSVPFLGICLGMQITVIEFARSGSKTHMESTARAWFSKNVVPTPDCITAKLYRFYTPSFHAVK